MITVQVRVLDFMERTPVGGARVTVILNVVPRWFDFIPPQPPLNRPVRIVASGPAETLEKQWTSPANGSLVGSSFNADQLFDRQRQRVPQGKQPLDAVAFVRIRIVVAGLDRTITFGELDKEKGTDLLGRDGSVTYAVGVDFAKAIVGHTTPNSTLLWFALHGAVRLGDSYFCEVESLALPDWPVPVQSLPVEFGHAGPANIVVVPVDGLQPATRYRYVLRLRERGSPESGRRLALGEFTTAPAASESLSFVFGSCHFPLGEHSLNRWTELAGRRDYDLMLLLGDQIYEDNIEQLGRDWFERYANRYHQFWTFWLMRDVLRRTPTYMIFDDHEVKDDWGVVDIENDKEPGRESGALQAYHAFQHSRNRRTGRKPGDARRGDSFYYSFEWGPAAFFVLDCRSLRSIPARGSHPILGNAKYEALSSWAKKTAAKADVAFVVATVPFAFVPVAEVLRMIEQLKKKGRPLKAVVGGAKGFLKGGPFGAVIGAYAGYREVEQQIERAGFADLTTNDLLDMWTYEHNQIELADILDLLFDLANDLQSIQTKSSGQRPRAVFVLSGDVHVGAMYVIASDPNKNKHHSRNRYITQLISSPISKPPTTDEVFVDVIRHIKSGRDISRWDLIRAGGAIEKVPGRVFGKDPALFVLDDKPADRIKSRFSAELVDLIVDRNFSRVDVQRAGKQERRYRFFLSIEGQSRAVNQSFELNLEANPIEPPPASALPAGVAEGDLIRSPEDPTVYLIANGARRSVADEATFFDRGWTWNRVKMVPATTIAAIPRGSDLPSIVLAAGVTNGDLIKSPDEPAVYLIENRVRRWVPDEATFLVRWTWDQVKHLPAEIVNKIPRGRDLPSVRK